MSKLEDLPSVVLINIWHPKCSLANHMTIELIFGV
jgi:hypothetical protein